MRQSQKYSICLAMFVDARPREQLLEFSKVNTSFQVKPLRLLLFALPPLHVFRDNVLVYSADVFNRSVCDSNTFPR